MHPSIHISTIYSGQDMQFKCSSTDKYKHVVHRKEWNNAMWSSMDGPRDYHTKQNKPDKHKCMMWSLKRKRKIQINLYFISNTETDSHT